MSKDSISTPQITYTAIINYFKKNYAYHNTPPSFVAISLIIQDIKNGNDSFIADSIVRNKLRELMSICKKDSLALFENPNIYCEIKQNIMDWENEIQANTSLSLVQKSTLMRVASIARHSMYLWLNVNLNTSPEARMRPNRFFKIFACDVLGGLAGGAVSGGLGFLLGVVLCSGGAYVVT